MENKVAKDLVRERSIKFLVEFCGCDDEKQSVALVDKFLKDIGNITKAHGNELSDSERNEILGVVYELRSEIVRQREKMLSTDPDELASA